ncbi:AMP-binding protein [Antrihabitans sp. YC2-6]|uniref:AMP-binding protein n=1 Tax=Antrihabitans sp. YC2-6 TaxID=2799498 RepID=UPI0018F7B383|nr:AMP-binding protein [Antrihabitans sp. YC2-6]MBJ8344845.1 AMP-binding protein [Antrihabitans sp. YC2-6]
MRTINENVGAATFTRLQPEMFTDAVELDPQEIAVSTADRRLTFAEVDSWSDRVADALIALGAGPDAHVVMALSPSIESFVAIWAVSKTGARLASVDPSDLYAPVGKVLSDPRITVGVTTRAQRRLVPDSINWLVLETGFEALGGEALQAA